MNVCGFRYYLITARKYLKYMTRLLPETILTDLRRGGREPTVEIGYRLQGFGFGFHGTDESGQL